MGIVSKYINERIHPFLCRNYEMKQIVAVAFLISLISFLFFLLPNYIYTALAGISAQIFSIFYDIESKAYEKFLIFAEFLIIFGFGITAWHVKKNIYTWLILFLIAAGLILLLYTDKYEEYKIPIEKDERLFIVFLFSIAYLPIIGLIIMALLINTELIRRIVR